MKKASAYLKHNGFRDVNQLHGGIIHYKKELMENPKLENKFVGKNFVFDERLSEKVSEEVISFVINAEVNVTRISIVKI